MAIPLSDHLTIRKLLLTATPVVFMMISISIYSVVDGYFISNYAGKTAFAAVNIIWPFVMILASLGFMMGTGGAALAAKALGEQDPERANRNFSNCVLFSILIGVLSCIPAYIFLPNIALMLGADEAMLPYCVQYGRILIIGCTFFNLQNLFQSFFSASEQPVLGFLITLGAGVTNIVLDAILVAGGGLGIVGAGIGTIAGQFVGAIIPFFYFIFRKRSLHLLLCRLEWGAVLKMASNGVSEFLGNISVSVLSIIMNILLMRHYGENGVDAYGIICYVWMVFAAIFIGYNISIAPRISYFYGAKNTKELRYLFLLSLSVLFLFGGIQTALSEGLAIPLSKLFAGYDEGLLELTIYAFRIYSLLYLFLGFNMFGSAFFTALNNGFISASLSLARLLIIELGCVVLFPLFLQGDGIWWGVVAGEGIAFIMNILVMFLFGNRYGYFIRKKAKKKPFEEEEEKGEDQGNIP